MRLTSLASMRRVPWRMGLVVASLLAATALARAQTPPSSSASVSPAEQRIVWARQAIDADPQRAQPYTELASALSRRARETGDRTFTDQAWEAVTTALAREPNHFAAKKLRIAIQLDRREFARAYEAAVALNKQAPDEVIVYGYVADACIALGKYKEAEEAAQWMLDIRSANPLGHLRAAALRELYGDVDGAVELLSTVFTRVPPNDVEERAWLLSRIGRLYHTIGKETEAEAALQQALILFPRYHVAVRTLAQVRLAQERASEAVELLQPLATNLPYAEHVYALANALDRAGRRAEAAHAFARFEKLALAESASSASSSSTSSSSFNANADLIAYYLDRAGRPSEALRIAELEYGRRQDVFTRGVYARALAANGRHAEARQQIDAIKASGVVHRDRESPRGSAGTSPASR